MGNPEFMREAIQLARAGFRDQRGGPFGAVIVQGGRILARACNQVLASNDPTAHAEVVAIREASRLLGRFHLGDCELYTSCEPCPMCLGAIYWARLARVYFAAARADAGAIGFQDDVLYEELPRPPEQRALPMAALLRDEALAVFEEWRTWEARRLY